MELWSPRQRGGGSVIVLEMLDRKTKNSAGLLAVGLIVRPALAVNISSGE